MNQKVSPSECKACGAQLSGKNVVRIGDQAFCSKACADAAGKLPGPVPGHPSKEK